MFLQKILSQLVGVLKAAYTAVANFGNRFGWWKTGIGVLLLIIGAWAIAGFFGSKGPVEEASSQLRTVEVRTAADLSLATSPLSVAGSVSSKSEASVRAEVGGQITHVYSALGNYVAAGSIVVEVNNSSQRAAVAQAQGAVDAAQAGIDAANVGTSVSQTTLTSAKENTVASLLGAYGSVDKAIHTDVDQMFSNPESANPQFTVQSSNSQAKIDTENNRSAIRPILARESAKSSTLSSSDDLAGELATTQKELRTIRDFLDSVILALNGGIATNGTTASTISGYIATANAARSAITGSISALVAAQGSLEAAQKNSSSGTPQSSSAAVLAQAQAGLASARAGLEKTIIRAPISGTVNSFSLKVGDYLSPGALAVTIANNGALEVVTYITDTDTREIAVGNSTTIENNGTKVLGIVTRIAPAIDPVTKKIEVHIGITSGADALVNGQSVTAAISRNARSANTNNSARITIPLSALKVGADTTSVFTVDENKKLVAHPVVLGTLLGDRVVIESGITADMAIVTDARGLQPGQEVIVK